VSAPPCIKVRVDRPEELIASIRARTGRGGFSQYVAQAVERKLRQELLSELVDEFTAEHGPIHDELLQQAAAEWPDYDAG
jgi:hypothetical protein